MSRKGVIITARRYASAVYAVVLCPPVCHKPVSAGPNKQRRKVAQGLWFLKTKIAAKFQRGQHQRRSQINVW